MSCWPLLSHPNWELYKRRCLSMLDTRGTACATLEKFSLVELLRSVLLSSIVEIRKKLLRMVSKGLIPNNLKRVLTGWLQACVRFLFVVNPPQCGGPIVLIVLFLPSKSVKSLGTRSFDVLCEVSFSHFFRVSDRFPLCHSLWWIKTIGCQMLKWKS